MPSAHRRSRYSGIRADGRYIRRVIWNNKLCESKIQIIIQWKLFRIHTTRVCTFKCKTKIISDSWNTSIVLAVDIHVRDHFRNAFYARRRVWPPSDFEKRTLSISWHRVPHRGSDQSGWTQFPARCNALIQCRGGRAVSGSRDTIASAVRIPRVHPGSEIRTCACTAAWDIIAATAVVSECVFANCRSRAGSDIQSAVFPHRRDLINFIRTRCSARFDKYLSTVSRVSTQAALSFPDFWNEARARALLYFQFRL